MRSFDHFLKSEICNGTSVAQSMIRGKGNSGLSLEDNRPQSLIQMRYNNSRQKNKDFEDTFAVQKAHQYSGHVLEDNRPEKVLQKKENSTGLPHRLKTNVEAFSGFSLDDVKVHYNSSKPSQLKAHAYAEGNQIHLGPGQEKHLPHETWHVVQQMQGRVQPTVQMKGALKVNDDPGLEKEADEMGTRLKTFEPPSSFSGSNNKGEVRIPVVQGFFEKPTGDLWAYIKQQSDEQSEGKDFIDAGVEESNIEPFTTVGFEAEFAQTKKDKNNLLSATTHLEFSKSDTPEMNYTGMDFILETDASETIELVFPPFLIPTILGRPIPNPEYLETIDGFIRSGLDDLVKSEPTMAKLINDFNARGFSFKLNDVEVEPKHLSSDNLGKIDKTNKKIEAPKIESIDTKISSKGAKPGTSTQINFATDIETIGLLNKVSEDSEGPNPNEYKGQMLLQYYSLEEQIHACIVNWMKYAKKGEYFDVLEKQTGKNNPDKMVPNFDLFIKLLSRALAGQIAVSAMDEQKGIKEKMFEDKDLQQKLVGPPEKGGNKQRFKNKNIHFKVARLMSSFVKDVNQLWVKDSLINIAHGMFPSNTGASKRAWITIWAMGTTKSNFLPRLEGLSLNKLTKGYTKPYLGFVYKILQGYLKSAIPRMQGAMITLFNEAKTIVNNNVVEDKFPAPGEEVPFMEHEEKYITPRQDTLVNPEKVQLPHFQKEGKKLHVVEARRDGLEMMKKLAELAAKESK